MDEQELLQEAETEYTIIKHCLNTNKSYPKFINKSHQPRAAMSPECSCQKGQENKCIMNISIKFVMFILRICIKLSRCFS
jgi:hypothetical protein